MRQAFVCVRITQMNGVDIGRFEFDYDTTWAGFFVDPDLNVYSRYGGRDEGEPEARLSTESLLHTMREVLDVHKLRSTGRQSGIPLLQPSPAKKRTPEDIPLLKKSHQGCVHCHQVREYQFLQWGRTNQFERSKLFAWPLPEKVGIEIDRKHGHRVERVVPNSISDKAGLKAGDVIRSVSNIPIRSELDLRWALGKSQDGKCSVVVERATKVPTAEGTEKTATDGNGELVKLSLTLTGEWRKTVLGWRKSMRSVPLEFGFRGYSLTASQRRREGISPERLAIRITTVRGGVAQAVGFKKQDIVTSIAGETRNRIFDEFQSFFVETYAPGDTVELTVRREGMPVKLSGRLPGWHTEESSVP